MSVLQKGRSSHRWPWFTVASSIVLSDQIIKELVHSLMPFGQVIPITPFFNWIHVGNTGAAFSFLADAGGWQRYLFIGLALVVVAVLMVQLCKPISRLESLSYSLFMGGAIGNAIDRLARGYVVDYLDIYWREWHWPAFNLADIALFAGVLVFAMAAWREVPAAKQPE
ncbi:lipoprotein signal peptidase [Halomonas cupida]|uniref:Lipoprotein signal peptidase n=1 Tax=Halomonas cupida TaxID=44933 RepID=A0A1M7KBL0_9GAMM|nr:signal peptidase II [Halomonas cupida]GEN24947.1 lipoprotein signal peptidase [Halomonas cupida]SHM62237.1 signal peptidase II [Halomonas cupida]